MKLLIRFAPAAATLFSLPFVVAANSNASDAPDLGFFEGIVTGIQGIVNLLIPLVVALALLFFFWGVFTYFILGAGDEGKRETGRAYMVYGLIGLVAIVAVWGLVELIVNILGVNSSESFVLPEPPGGFTE